MKMDLDYVQASYQSTHPITINEKEFDVHELDGLSVEQRKIVKMRCKLIMRYLQHPQTIYKKKYAKKVKEYSTVSSSFHRYLQLMDRRIDVQPTIVSSSPPSLPPPQKGIVLFHNDPEMYESKVEEPKLRRREPIPVYKNDHLIQYLRNNFIEI